MTRLSVLVACFTCCTFGASIAATDETVALDFTPLGAAAHSASASTQLAPADESFGKYQMSVIGIENAIHRNDGTTRLNDGPIAYAVDALRDLESRFPQDPAIARDLFGLQRVYEHARTYEGFGYAQRIAKWLRTDYPETKYATWSGWDLARIGAPPQ